MIFLRKSPILRQMTLGLRNGFGSYYKMVKMFSEIEATSGNKNKMSKIKEYRQSLSEEDRTEFNSLISWYSRKEPIRISSKAINKYYLNKLVEPAEYAEVQPELAEGGIMRRLSKNDEESELSIYDVNLFLRYLCALEGTGSATEKAQKIISFGSNASVLEGIFLLKLIERKLTIGASNKTFRKANQKVDEEDTPKQQVKPKKPRKKKQPKAEVDEEDIPKQQVKPKKPRKKKQPKAEESKEIENKQTYS